MKKQNYEKLGVDFGNAVITLHKRKRRYRREAAALSDVLIRNGTEAGELICGLNLMTDVEERYIRVKECLTKVERTVYYARAMEEADIYLRRHVEPFYKRARSVSAVLNEDLALLEAAVARRAKRAATKTVTKTKIVKKVAPKPVVIADDDGFNDYYYD